MTTGVGRQSRLAPVVAVLGSLLACVGPAPPGIIRGGDIELHGAVDPDYLMAQLVQIEPRWQGCYARALARNRTREGVIGLDLAGGDRRLAAAVTSNTTGDTVLARCVTGAVADIVIVEPDTGPRWHYTGTWSVEFRIARRPDRNGGP